LKIFLEKKKSKKIVVIFITYLLRKKSYINIIEKMNSKSIFLKTKFYLYIKIYLSSQMLSKIMGNRKICLNENIINHLFLDLNIYYDVIKFEIIRAIKINYWNNKFFLKYYNYIHQT